MWQFIATAMRTPDLAVILLMCVQQSVVLAFAIGRIFAKEMSVSFF
jgi:hypothetical protein